MASDAQHPRPTPAVLAPAHPIVTGGSAEKLEQDIQALFDGGHRDVAVNLFGVPYMDSEGLKGLVRGHTTARSRGWRFRILTPSPRVRLLLKTTKLDTVLEICESFDPAGDNPRR